MDRLALFLVEVFKYGLKEARARQQARDLEEAEALEKWASEMEDNNE